MTYRTVDQDAIDLMHEFEELVLTAYMDPVGVPTIGWGHTKTVTAADVRNKRTITREQAETLFRDDLRDAQAAMERLIKPEILSQLTDNQYGALVSWVFNLGPKPTATLWKRLNAGIFDEVPVQMQRWVYAKDRKTGQNKRLPGLVRRRRAEADLWNLKDPVTAPAFYGATSAEIMEGPEPVKPKKKDLVAGVTAAAAGTAAATTEAIQHVSPLAGLSEHVGAIVTVLAVVAAVAGLWLVIVKRRESAEARGEV